MDKILVHGGNSLAGSIKISGSKNSALPILAATLLTREPCTIHRVPDLSDVHYMLQILDHRGRITILGNSGVPLESSVFAET